MRFPVTLAAGLLTTTSPSEALVVDFSLAAPAPGGRLLTNTYTSGPVTVEAYYLNSAGNYVNTDTYLSVRRQSGDNGFGVCSPGQVGRSACALVGTFTGVAATSTSSTTPSSES